LRGWRKASKNTKVNGAPRQLHPEDMRLRGWVSAPKNSHEVVSEAGQQLSVGKIVASRHAAKSRGSEAAVLTLTSTSRTASRSGLVLHLRTLEP